MKHNYFKSSYQFGILGGGLSILSFLILSFLYADPTNLNLVFGYVVTPIALFLSIKFFKDYTGNGYLSFAEGMTVGFLTYLLIAVISSIGIWIILLLVPDVFATIKQVKLSVLDESMTKIIDQVGEESYRTTRENMISMDRWDVALNDGLWKIIPGMFFSIIISIILRKNPT